VARVTPLTLDENNDETIDLTVTADVTIDPAQATFELYIKTSATEDDADGTKLTDGDGLTVTSTEPAKTIALTADIPASALATPGTRFWRLDVIVDGKRGTAMYGPLRIRDL
jgi:hypothetical protein